MKRKKPAATRCGFLYGGAPGMGARLSNALKRVYKQVVVLFFILGRHFDKFGVVSLADRAESRGLVPFVAIAADGAKIFHVLALRCGSLFSVWFKTTALSNPILK